MIKYVPVLCHSSKLNESCVLYEIMIGTPKSTKYILGRGNLTGEAHYETWAEYIWIGKMMLVMVNRRESAIMWRFGEGEWGFICECEWGESVRPFCEWRIGGWRVPTIPRMVLYTVSSVFCNSILLPTLFSASEAREVIARMVTSKLWWRTKCFPNSITGMRWPSPGLQSNTTCDGLCISISRRNRSK